MSEPPRYSRWLPFLVAALATMGPFSIDTYLPSFPAIAADLGASDVALQQTLTAYLIPFAFMMLFHGAISDAVGRKPVILVGVGGFFIASVGCALATSMPMLLAFRAMQGLVVGAGTAISRAVIRDAYQGHEAQRLMSRVMLIFSIAPAIAPVIGGLLQSALGWRSIFWFLALVGVVLFALCWRFLPETHPHHARQRFAPVPLLAAYRLVGLDRRFLALSLTSALNFAGFFVYVLSAPAFIYRHLGLGAHEFAWIFLAGVAGMMAGSYLSGRLAGKVTPARMVWIAYAVMAAATLYNVLYYVWFPPQVPWSVVHQVVYATGMALAMPAITLMVLDLFPHNRGMAASLQAFVQSLTIGLVAGIASPLLSVSAQMLALGAMGFLAAGFLMWLWGLKIKG